MTSSGDAWLDGGDLGEPTLQKCVAFNNEYMYVRRHRGIGAATTHA